MPEKITIPVSLTKKELRKVQEFRGKANSGHCRIEGEDYERASVRFDWLSCTLNTKNGKYEGVAVFERMSGGGPNEDQQEFSNFDDLFSILAGPNKSPQDPKAKVNKKELESE